jgi:hypothetical protein
MTRVFQLYACMFCFFFYRYASCNECVAAASNRNSYAEGELAVLPPVSVKKLQSVNWSNDMLLWTDRDSILFIFIVFETCCMCYRITYFRLCMVAFNSNSNTKQELMQCYVYLNTRWDVFMGHRYSLTLVQEVWLVHVPFVLSSRKNYCSIHC